MYTKGHYYSPYPDLNYIRDSYRDDEIEYLNDALNINTESLKEELLNLSRFRREIDFSENKQPERCYFHDNVFFRYADAWVYAAMLLRLRPQRVIEIGSGFSTALAIDINRKHFNEKIDIITIDPHQERLLDLIKEEPTTINIIEKSIFDIELSYFQSLKENDILFVDSSHVLKQGSDLNYILFQILPILKSGVVIHFHDIFLFNYPKSYIMKGIAWNESYAIRAFLSFNNQFEIFFLNKFVISQFEDLCIELFPELLVGHGGSSLYIIRK
jgi:cephalosporin hydroxylase